MNFVGFPNRQRTLELITHRAVQFLHVYLHERTMQWRLHSAVFTNNLSHTLAKARNWKKKPSAEIIIDYFRLRRNYTTRRWNYINQFLMGRPSVRCLSICDDGSDEGGRTFRKSHKSTSRDDDDLSISFCSWRWCVATLLTQPGIATPITSSVDLWAGRSRRFMFLMPPGTEGRLLTMWWVHFCSLFLSLEFLFLNHTVSFCSWW